MTGPVIVQGDMTILLEVDHPQYETARDALSAFAEIVKSPEYIHTYAITPLSLWNAASAGVSAEKVVSDLETYAKHSVAETVKVRIKQLGDRYGRVKLVKEDGALYMTADDSFVMTLLAREKSVSRYFLEEPEHNRVRIDARYRGHIKQALMNLQYPPEDLAGFASAAELKFCLREVTSQGLPFAPRNYQLDAVRAFHADGKPHGGHGVIVLPCGAGKTIVGMAAMEKLQTETLILTTSITAVRQWKSELLDKTTLTEEQLGEYSGERKEICPVTISTYQILSAKNSDGQMPHFELFEKREWGLIIYDEVHTLPAPVFRVTAELQARRRLGLTATLIREDNLQSDVFALIGPKRHEVAWKVLESRGFIAEAECCEIRVPMPGDLKMPYALAEKREKFRIAAENPEKLKVVRTLLERHAGSHILVIGQYLDQLKILAKELDAPIITGATKNKKRDELYEDFRTGKIPVMVVSKVANYAIDLPDANVAIEVSGTFGSRQEEAQRLGRILRPKDGENKAWFYTLVSKDTREEEFAAHRQLFLVEQGYPYKICEAEI